MKKKKILFIFILVESLFSNWHSNGSILSKIPFDILEKKYNIIITNQFVFSNSKKDLIKINFTNFNQTLTSNEIENFNEYIEDYNKLSNIEIKKVVSNHIFDRYGEITQSNSNEYTPLEPKNLETEIETGEILLLNADNFTSVKIRQFGISQQMVEITGDVQVKINDTFIRSEILNYNFSTRTLYAKGDVLLKVGDIDVEVEKVIFDIAKNKGILYGLKGTLVTPLPSGISSTEGGENKMYYIASRATINDDEHLTLYDVEATYDSNKQPYVYMDFKKLDSFGKEKILIRNIVFKIHDHPLFYFPFFFQNPFGTGIEIKWGETDREGIFIENSLELNLPVINKLKMELNFYQKIGAYLGIKNANSYDKNNYELHLALARTYVGDYPFVNIGRTFYDNFLSSLENEAIRYRYKIDYKHFFNLTAKKSEGKGIDTTLRYNFKKTGIAGQSFGQNDPFFTSELEDHHPRAMQFADLLNLNNYNEPVFIPAASDTDNFYLTLNQSFPGSSLRIHSQWNYEVSPNTTSANILDEDRYIQVLNSVNLPHITYSLFGTIDPIDSENERRNTFLNLNYRTSINYNLLQEYEREGHESFFEANKNTLNMDLSISRPFAWDKNTKTKQNWKILNMNYNTSLNVSYKKQWGASILNDNTDRFNDNRRNTYVDLKIANSFSVHFPSQYQRQIFDNQLGFSPMIPKLDFHFNYNLDFRELTEEDNNNPLFSYTARHGFNTSMKLSQNGYGLFMIPWLNYTQSLNASFGYNLRPDLEDPYGRLRDIDIQPLTDKFQPRITQLIWDYRFGLRLELPKINFIPLSFDYSVNFLVFNNNDKILNEFRWDERSQTLIDKRKQKENFKLNLRFIQQKFNALFFFKSLNLELTYERYGQIEQFYNDKININFVFSLHFFKFFDINIQIGSYNNRAYLYEPNRVEQYNEISSGSSQPVNFFEDILASLGLKGQNNNERLANQRTALFKTSGIRINLNHDLDTWQLNASYEVEPTAIRNTSSLRGFFFDQRFYLSITLKPQFDFFNLNENFKPWDIDLSPDELERLR